MLAGFAVLMHSHGGQESVLRFDFTGLGAYRLLLTRREDAVYVAAMIAA